MIPMDDRRREGITLRALIPFLCASLVVGGIWQSVMRADENSKPAKSNSKQTKGEVRGRVVMQSDGKPVVNADVRLVTWTENGQHYDVKKTRSDKNGGFAFNDLGTGKHRLVAFFEDFSSREAQYKGEPVDVSSQQPITLTLRKMPQIAVHVVSKVDSKPVAGALVQLVWSDTERDHRSDASGNVLLRTLTHEVWHVKVQATGFASKEEAVNLAGTETANIKFELEPGGVLHGTVKDEAGNALTMAGVSVFPANFSGPQIEYMTTDFKGRFRFDALPLEKGMLLIVSKTGFVEVRPEVVLGGASGNDREVNLVLKRLPDGGSIRGTVTDAEGKPVAGATIVNQGQSSADVRKATSDKHGAFQLNNVFERTIGHELIVKAKDFAPQRIAFKPGTKEKPAEIAIRLEKGHRIRGRVQAAAGKSIAGARVYYSDGNRGDGMLFGGGTTTDSTGKFEFDSLPNDAPFSIEADGYSEIEVDKLPLDGKDEVIVTLQQEGVIRGKVIDAATRKPISPFNVQITFSPDRGPNEPGHHLGGARATTPSGEKFASPKGTFLLNELIVGMPLQVTVSASGYERQVYPRVVAKEKSEADEIIVPLLPLDASKLVSIRGRLFGANRKPIAGAELRLITADKVLGDHRPGLPFEYNEYPYSWQMIQSGQVESIEGVSQFMSTVSGKDGGFVFERVRSAPFMEIAYWGEGVSQDRLERIEKLSNEERGNITIKSVTPGAIRGKIDRKALPEVGSVMLTPADDKFGFDYRQAEISANDTGFELRNIPPGKYELIANGPYIRTVGDGMTNKVLQRRAVEVRAGEIVTVDIGTKQ